MFSGAMDVIVIKKPNNEFSSTSFHVRFGSLKLLQSKDQIVEIFVNGNKTPLEMKLSSSGDAFFTHNEEGAISPLEMKNCQINNYQVIQDNNEIKKNDFSILNIQSKVNEIQLNHNKIIISNSYKEILDNREKAREIFLKNIISKERFFNDPWLVLNNKNTVFLIDEILYDFQAAIPIIMSSILYKEQLPNKKITELITKTGLMYSFTKNQSINEISRIRIPNINDEYIKQSIVDNKTKKIDDNNKKIYKSLFPTSSQLKSLKLQNERNEICFVCKSSLSGIQRLKAEIYLWGSESKIIISDIDGTITKSDILGQIMPMIGSEWNHQGITELFTNIEKNKYKFLYLTARAICQSQLTRNYLMSLFQEKKSLPLGPMLMSPDGLFSSFKREAIEKSPHLLKISTLTEIRALFPQDYCPFYSGFGNRETVSDVIMYYLN